ncbi:MAG: DNA repair protein RadC [Flavobacteriales bacterium]|jgi:DNA repair protein RadC
MSLVTSFSIKQWAESERPREKLMQKGISSLTNAELLAIIIGSGTRSLSAVELSRQILNEHQDLISLLSRKSVEDLMKYKGIGEAKAISIVASLEFGRRSASEPDTDRLKVNSSNDIERAFGPLLRDLNIEEFWILLLNRSNKEITRKRVSIGGVSGTVVDAKVIFKLALDFVASSIVLIHNHPSGNDTPSHADTQLTKQLKEAGKTLDIPILDHLIIAGKKYFSFADNGLL